MLPSTLCALVVALSSFAVVNGAVVQRDGTFTYTTPQPIQGGAGGTPATTSSGTVQTSRTTSSTSTTQSTSPTMTSSTSTVRTTSGTVPVSGSTTATTTATAKSSPTTTATATSTAAPGTANCNGVQEWQPALAYTAGAQVIFNGQLFTAKQWTYNNSPPAHPDQWSAVGTCAQPINNKANCNGVAAWQNNVAYTAGNQVTFKGHLWSAVQWTYSNAPGDASGSWKDLGACA